MTEPYFDEELDEDVEYYAIRPNKTRIKQEIAEVFSMVEEICGLSPTQIAEFEMPENLEQVVIATGKMAHDSARKRQLKYITAQIRALDTKQVAEKLARIKNQSAHTVREHHQAERLRDLLLADTGNTQLTQVMNDYPHADSQHLRQLQRNAQKEAAAAKPPRSARLLYKYLRDLVSEAG